MQSLTVLWMVLLARVFAQDQLDAYVKIIDNDKAGELGIYRFTVQVMEGSTVMQTFLPAELQLQTQGQPEVCRFYLISQTAPIESCSFDVDLNMMSFDLEPDYDGYLVYDIGYLINPAYSTSFLSGFMIQTLDVSLEVLAMSDPFAVSVIIKPNEITDQSLEVGSLQIAASTTYLFQLTVTNAVPAGGYVQLTFPSTQIAVPDESPESTISLNGGSTWLNAQVTQTTSTTLTLRVLQEIPAFSTFKLKMLEISNPNTMAETQSFAVKTMTSTYRVIDQVLDGLTVDCNLPAVVQIESVSVSTKKVGSRSTLTVKLTLPTKYSSGGYLLIKLPATLSIDSNFQCILLIGFNTDNGSCLQTSNDSIMLYDNINQQQLVFAIQGLVNPPNTMQTANFVFQAYDPDGNMIAVSAEEPSFGFTPTPGSVTAASSTRAVNVVGTVTDLTLSFQTSNIIQTYELVRIEIPSTHFQLPTTLVCNTKTQYDSAMTNETPCELSLSDSSFTIKYAVNCDANSKQNYCATSTTHTVELLDLNNIGWIASTISESVKITTMTSDQQYLIDEKTSSVSSLPKLIEGTFTNPSLSKVTGVVGDSTSFEFSITTQNVVPQGGHLTIDFSDETFQEPESKTLVCRSSSPSSLTLECQYLKYSSGYISSITIQKPCGSSECKADQILSLSVENLRNPKSVKPITNSFTFRSYTSLNQAIDKVAFTQASGLEVTPASLVSVELRSPVSPTEIKTGALQTYVIAVKPLNGLQASLGKMEIKFPIENTISESTSCNAYEESSLRALSCQVLKDTFIVTHTNSNYDYADKTIVVTGLNVVNPPTTKESSHAEVITYLASSSSKQTYYDVDQSLDAFNSQANTANQLVSVGVTRTVDLVNVQTQLDFCFVPYNPVPAGSIITVEVPEDQAIFGTQVTTDLQLVKKTKQMVKLATINTVESGQESCFYLAGSVTNPSTTKPPSDSITMTIKTDDGDLIDEMTSNIFATPFLSAGPFQDINIFSTKNTVGAATDLMFTVTLSASLPSNSYIYVALPTSTFYTQESLSLQYQIGSGSFRDCESIVTKTDQLGVYYQSLRLKVDQSYSSGQALVFRLHNMRNKFNTGSTTSQITVQSQDSSSYTVNSSQFSLSLSYEPNLLGYFSATRSSLQVQSSTNINLEISLQTRIATGSHMIIYLPFYWFVDPWNIKVSLDNENVGFTQSSTDDHYEIEFNMPICDDNSQFSVTISGFKNRYSVDTSSEYISLKTKSKDGFVVDVIGQTAFSDMLTPASVSISGVNLGSKIVGSSTVLSIGFKAEGYAKVGDTVTVRNMKNTFFQTDYQNVMFNSKFVPFEGLPMQNGAYWLGFSFVLVDSLQNSFTIDVSGLQNLHRAEPLQFGFDLSVTSSSGGYIFSGRQDIEDLSLLMPAQFSQVSLVRESSVVTTKTQLEISFEIQEVDIYSKSTLEVLIPKIHLITSDENCETNSPLSCFTSDYDSEYTMVQVTNICQAGCPLGEKVKLVIKKGLMNPEQAVYSDISSLITLSNTGYSIAMQKYGIDVEPQLQTAEIALSDLSFTQIGDIAGAATSLQFEFNIDKDNVPISLISIIIPKDTFIFDSAEPECFIGKSDSVPCTVSQKSKTIQGEPTFVLKLTITGVKGKIQADSLALVTINNFRNSDIPSYRNNEDKISITLVSETNLIMASDMVQIQQILIVPVIEAPQLVRTLTQSGEQKVLYLLSFSTPNYIRYDGYIMLRVPNEQAVVESRSLQCSESSSGRTVSCKLKQTDSGYQYIWIKQWCKDVTPSRSTLCRPEQALKLSIVMSNPTEIQNTGLQVYVDIFTDNDEQVAGSEGLMVTPELDGLNILDPSMRRHTNVLGAQNESLTVFVRQLGSSVLVDTDLFVTFPEGLIYPQKMDKIYCIRSFNGDKQVVCNVTQFHTETKSIKQIVLRKFCSQSLICMNEKSLEVKILNLVNPTSNIVFSQEQTILSFKQGNREIGFVGFDSSMTLMTPGTSDSIVTKTLPYCATLKSCAVNVTMSVQNPIKAGDYIVLTSDLSFLSQICSTLNSLPLSCIIDSSKQLRLVASQRIETSLITFQVKSALMPASSQPVSSFTATSYEVIGGRAVEMENFSGGSITVVPSQFRNITIKRMETMLDATTDLRVFIKTRQKAQGDFLQIQIPTSVELVPNGDVVSCTAYDKPIDCQVLSQTVTVPNFDKWCLQADVGCVLIIKNVKNPDSLVYGPSLPIQFSLYLGTVGSDTLFDVHKTSMSATPALTPDELDVTQVQYLPLTQLETGQQQISLSFQFQSNVKDGRYLVVTIEQTNFMPLISQLYQLEVTCEGQRAEIIDIQLQKDTQSLKAIKFALPYKITPGQQNQVLVEGLTAQNYLNSPEFDKSVITVAYLKSAKTEVARKKVEVRMDLAAAQMTPITAYSDNPFVSQTASFYLSFNLKPQMTQGTIILEIPAEFQILRDFQCSDLNSMASFSCRVISFDTISLSFTDGGSRPYTGFSLKLEQFRNPSQIHTGLFKLMVVDSGFLYALGTFTLQTSTQQVCTPSQQGCDKCTSLGDCASCVAGYVLNSNTCGTLCGKGMFEIDGRCYACTDECLQCQRQDSCSVCPDGEVIMNGICLAKCPQGYLLNKDMNICEFSSQQTRVDCKSEARRDFLIDTLMTDNTSEFCDAVQQPKCDSGECKSCNLLPGYCDKCVWGTRKLDGQCVKQCPSGYFEYDYECFRCSPACEECDQNANVCISCRPGLLFTEGYNTCVQDCPVGTFALSSSEDIAPEKCVQCDDTCNSCQYSTTQCTSCFRHFATQKDLFYSEGECVEVCPFGTQTDYKLHRCVEPLQSVLEWCLPLAAIALLFVFTVTRMSRCFGKKNDRQFWVACALLNLVDFINRVVLVAALWPTVEIWGFCVSGIYTLGLSLMGIYESQLVQIKGRPAFIGLLTSITGPYTTRWLLGNPFSKYLNVTNNRQLPWDQFEKCCHVQTVLIVMQLINCIVVISRFGLNETPFGIAVNGLIFGGVQLMLQVLIKFCDRKVPQVGNKKVLNKHED